MSDDEVWEFGIDASIEGDHHQSVLAESEGQAMQQARRNLRRDYNIPEWLDINIDNVELIGND